MLSDWMKRQIQFILFPFIPAPFPLSKLTPTHFSLYVLRVIYHPIRWILPPRLVFSNPHRRYQSLLLQSRTPQPLRYHSHRGRSPHPLFQKKREELMHIISQPSSVCSGLT